MIPTTYHSIESIQNRSEWSSYLWILGSAIILGFGNSLEPVSTFALIHPFVFIVSFEKLFEQHSKSRWPAIQEHDLVITCLIFLAVHSCGMTLGFAGLFAFPNVSFLAILFTLFASFLWLLVLVVLAILPFHFSVTHHPTWVITPYIFTISYLSASASILGQFVTSFPCVGNAALDIGPLRPLASLFGIATIELVVVLPGSTIALAYLDPASRSYQRAAKLGCGIALAMTVLGGFMEVGDRFYQHDSAELLPARTLAASCVFAQNAGMGTKAWNATLDATRARVAAGDDVVLWSETALLVRDTEQERELLEEAARLGAGRAYVGVTYLLEDAVAAAAARGSNRFALVAPDGRLAWNYGKAYPVPLVENNVLAGPARLPFHQAAFGLVTGAICFDLDHPQYISQAGVKGATLLLQPSWTWGAVGPRHMEGNTIRAAENGLTILRCSSDGVSGVVDPRGATRLLAQSGSDPSLPLTVPLGLPAGGGGVTVWAWGGWVAPWVLLAPACLVFALPWMPRASSAAVVRALWGDGAVG